MTTPQINTMDAIPGSTTTGGGTASGPTADQLAAGQRGIELAVAATTVVAQFRQAFPHFAKDGFAGAVLTASPVLFLNPASQGSGLGGFLMNPKVLAGAAAAALFIAKDMSEGKAFDLVAVQFSRVDREITTGNQCKFWLDVVDDQGGHKPAPADRISYTSSAPQIAEVSKDGVVKGKGLGTATITASIDDKSDVVTVHVTDSHHPKP
jgi:hypothetical protein